MATVQEQITALEAKIKKLEDDARAKANAPQLKLPIDVITKALIRENLPVFRGVNTAGSVAVGGYIELWIDGIKYQILYK